MALERKSLDGQAVALLTLSLVGYPAIAPIPLFLNLTSTAITVPFRAVVLAIAVNIIARESLNRIRVRSTPFLIVWSVFWTLYIGRILVDSILAPETLRMPLSEYLLWAVGTCLLPALGVWSRMSEGLMRRAYYASLALGTVAIVANLLYIATNFASLSLQAFFITRVESSTLNAITLAHLGVTVFILSAWGLVHAEIRKRLPIGVLLATGLLGIVAAVMAASRAPLLILVVIVPLLLYQGFRTDRRAAALLSLLVLLPTVAVMWLLKNVESIAAISRLQNFASDDARRQLWSGAWELFLAHPLLGAGTEPLGYYPHNTILESLLLYGVFSGLLYVTLLGVSTVAALKLLSSKADSGWVSLLYFQTTLGQMVSGALYGPPSQWVLMVAVIALWQAQPARSTASAQLPGSWAPAGAT